MRRSTPFTRECCVTRFQQVEGRGYAVGENYAVALSVRERWPPRRRQLPLTRAIRSRWPFPMLLPTCGCVLDVVLAAGADAA
jgi:hypothetical protein